MIGGFLDPFESRLEKLAESYDKISSVRKSLSRSATWPSDLLERDEHCYGEHVLLRRRWRERFESGDGRA